MMSQEQNDLITRTGPKDAAGKLMMLKMRRDYKEQQGARYSVRAFHDAVLAQGSAPFWAHRRLLLNETADASLE